MVRVFCKILCLKRFSFILTFSKAVKLPLKDFKQLEVKSLSTELKLSQAEDSLYFTGVYPPFSVLVAERDSGEGLPLWSEGYEETSSVTTSGFPREELYGYDLPLLTREWSGNVSRTYEIRPEKPVLRRADGNPEKHVRIDRMPVEPGNYTIEDTIGYSESGRSDKELSYQINFTLE